MLEDVSISKISTLADAYRYNIGYNKLANTDYCVKNIIGDVSRVLL